MHRRLVRLSPALGLVIAAACHSTEPVIPPGADLINTPLPASLVVGDLVRLNVNGIDDCTNPIYHVARVEAIGDKSMILADTLNPKNGFTTVDYQRYAAKFDTLIYPLDAGAFGDPTDIDNNGRVGIIFTRAVNELTPRGATSYVGGFTFSRDLFPLVANARTPDCATSNQGEYFYALAPDPAGVVNGNKRTTGFVDSATVPVLAHEFQHLINASRKIYVNTAADSLETPWLDEGLAHTAEELLFYRESGFTPRMNIDTVMIRSRNQIRVAFNEDMSGNGGRYRSYLMKPSDYSPYNEADSLETRGAIWSWLRYLADMRASGVTRSAAADIELAGPGSTTVPGGTGGADYYAVLVNTSQAQVKTAAFATTGYSVVASNVITPVGSFSPLGAATLSRSPVFNTGALSSASTLRRDVAFEAQLRARERAMAPSRLAGARAWYRTANPHIEMPQGGRFSVSAAVIPSPDGDLWFRLVNGTARGFRNMQNVFTGVDLSLALSDWAMSNAVDDLSSLPAEQFTQKSWNWRSIYGALYGAYPLQQRTMIAGTPFTGALVPGGAAFFRLGVAPAGTANITVSSTDAGASGLRLVIVRTR